MFKVIFAILVAASVAHCNENIFSQNIDNSMLTVGDTCQLDNGRKGICSELMKCETAKKLLREKKSSQIVKCAFKGKMPLVCCGKSQKFMNALCDNQKPGIGFDFKITNGLRADVGQFPYQAALGARDLNGDVEFKCGGSLIADNVVLTAAHCINKKDRATMVRLGRTSLNLDDKDDDSDHEDIDIAVYKMHPKYSSQSRHHDIALLKLKRPYKSSNPTIKPICLATSDQDVPTNLTITGYGQTIGGSSTKSTLSDWLLVGTVQRYSLDECNNQYKTTINKKIIESQFCASSDTGVDACQGDSGGALTFKKDGRFNQYGVVSFGIGCGSTFPSIYTKVNQYLDWINDAMMEFES